MQTSKWGKPGWDMMFYVAAGYELNELPEDVKGAQYKNYFQSIGHVLPCKYCRESYADFFEELDFDQYLDKSCGLMRFVYDMKNKVNEKLRNQERLALRAEFEKLSKSMSPSDPRFWTKMHESAQRICYTKPTPPFNEVFRRLQMDKARCSADLKTCREPMALNEYNEPQRGRRRSRSRH